MCWASLASPELLPVYILPPCSHSTSLPLNQILGTLGKYSPDQASTSEKTGKGCCHYPQLLCFSATSSFHCFAIPLIVIGQDRCCLFFLSRSWKKASASLCFPLVLALQTLNTQILSTFQANTTYRSYSGLYIPDCQGKCVLHERINHSLND